MLGALFVILLYGNYMLHTVTHSWLCEVNLLLNDVLKNKFQIFYLNYLSQRKQDFFFTIKLLNISISRH